MARARAYPIALAVLVVGSTAVRYAAARAMPTPWIAPDEMLYGLLGRSLWASGHLDVLGHRGGFYSLVHPALIGLPLSLGDTSRGYDLAKAVGALAMSATAVPVYLWGRTLVRPGWALLAAALTLAAGALAYSATLMSEVAFYPVFCLAAWATARAIERPTAARQLVLAGALALAAATRLQALALAPAALLAVAIAAALRRDARLLRAFAPLAAVGIALAAAAVFRGAESLGGYTTVAYGGYRAGDVASFAAYHLAGLLLACGVVPLCALVPLLLEAARGRERSREAQALLAVTVAFAAVTVVEVGVFASRYSLRVEERGLLGVVPLLFLVFALWLDRGAPRTYGVAAVTAFAAAAALVAVPYDRFVELASVPDSPTFAAALRLLPGASGAAAVAVPAVALAALFAVVPRRAAGVLAALVLVVLVLVSVGATAEMRRAAQTQRSILLGADPRWVDHAHAGPAAYVFGGGAFFTATWANAFWNRAVRAVYDLPGAHVGGPMPQRMLTLAGDGVLRVGGRPMPYGYAVPPGRLTADGERLATTHLTGSDEGAYVLWRLRGTPRILEHKLGFAPNGDISYAADMHEYGCARGGTFLVTFVGKEPQRVALRLNGRPVRTVPIGPGEARTEFVHARPAADGSCTLAIRPTTLVGTTQTLFARG